MKRTTSICLVIVVLLALTGVAGAITTGGATAVGNNNFTLHATGATGDSYFRYGLLPDWQGLQTVTATPAAGVVEINVYGAPIMPSTLYYAKACDTTGCDETPVSFTTTAVTLITERDDEDPITNMTRSRFNLAYLPGQLTYPYTILFPGQESVGITIITGLIFTGLFVGFWLKSKSSHTGIFVGILVVSMLGTTGAAALGIPGEFLGIAQGLCYASIAGVLLSLLKK